MTKKIFFKTIFLMMTTIAMGSLYAAPKVTFSFDNIEKADGKIFIAVVINEEAYNQENPANELIAYKGIVSVGSKDVEISVAGMKPGEYAAIIYHDLNGNSKLDTNSLGIPKEPYGFSNNPRGLFGRPKFKDSKFTLKDQDLHFKIKLH